ncbi:hypothetical protein BH10BAC5_BH10BAC5_24220 [soil metagenome]
MNLSKKYIALAGEFSKKFIYDKNVKAILLTGSAVKNKADEFSDIDMTIFYEKGLSKNYFEKIKKEAIDSGGGFYHGDASNGFAVFNIYKGVKIDTGHSTIAQHEKMMYDYLKEPNMNLDNQLIASGFQIGIPLYGSKYINKWKRDFNKYPALLAKAMVKENLSFHSKWIMANMGIKRGEYLWTAEMMLRSFDKMVKVLCGLNKLYYPGKFKGMDHTIKQMKHKPKEIDKLYKDLFHGDIKKNIYDLNTCIERTIDLVEVIMPEINTERTRWLFTWRG